MQLPSLSDGVNSVIDVFCAKFFGLRRCWIQGAINTTLICHIGHVKSIWRVLFFMTGGGGLHRTAWDTGICKCNTSISTHRCIHRWPTYMSHPRNKSCKMHALHKLKYIFWQPNQSMFCKNICRHCLLIEVSWMLWCIWWWWMIMLVLVDAHVCLVVVCSWSRKDWSWGGTSVAWCTSFWRCRRCASCNSHIYGTLFQVPLDLGFRVQSILQLLSWGSI